jgi:predicted DNA-binding transcriptional regulator AlpA
MIAALAKLAKINVAKPSSAAAAIESQTALMGARIAARTIENHLGRIYVALMHLKEHRDMSINRAPLGSLPATGYVRQSQLIPAIFPFSSATLWRKVKAGTFPKPVKLGPRITAWRVEDIHAFIAHIGQ